MQAPAPDSTPNKELGMVCMKMLSLAVLAKAKGVSPDGAMSLVLGTQRCSQSER
jgi:hypothetical protein